MPELPQIPSIQHSRQPGGGTSERGLKSRPPHIRAILDAGGRIAVLITHDTDIADGWERAAEDPQFPPRTLTLPRAARGVSLPGTPYLR